jgi:hypothetical protein
MYIGLWLYGLKKLTLPADWVTLAVLLVAAILAAALGVRFFDNPLRFVAINRWVLLVILVVICGGVVLQMNDGVLPPHGVVSFEMARDADTAKDILTKWDEGIIHAVRRQTWLDFLFVLAYVALLSFACFWIAEKTNGILSHVGLTLGWAVPIAGLFDVVENIALLKMLDSGSADLPAKIAYWMALPKFVILLYFVIPFILLSAVFWASGIPSRLRK